MFKGRQYSTDIFDKNASLALKGIAIILMMIHHNFRDTSLFSTFSISFFPFSERSVVSFAYACKICVSLFAFISGYGLYFSYKSSKTDSTRWFLYRYIKTFSGYWFVWGLSAVICQIINGRTSAILFKDGYARGIINTLIDFLGLHSLFSTPSINGTWWYMSAAAVFIIMIPVLYQLRDSALLVLIGSVFFIRVFHNGSSFTGGNSVYAFITPFILGFIFADKKLFDKILLIGEGKPSVKVYKAIVEIWLIILLFKLYPKIPIDYFWELHFCIFPIIVIIFCVEFIVQIRSLRKILIFLGKHSMNVFLVHTFIRAYYLRDLTYSFGHFLLISLFLLSVSIFLSVMIEQLKILTKYNRLIDSIIISWRLV